MTMTTNSGNKTYGVVKGGTKFNVDPLRPLATCTNLEQEYPGITQYIEDNHFIVSKSPKFLAPNDFPPGYEAVKAAHPHCWAWKPLLRKRFGKKAVVRYRRTRAAYVKKKLATGHLINEGAPGIYPAFLGARFGMRAHRLVYILFNNSAVNLRKVDVVAHLCGNHRCVNPAHLIATDKRTNAQHTKHHKTLTCAMSPRTSNKVNEQDVFDMRVKYHTVEGMTQADLALEYGISPNLVSKILMGHFWKDAGGPIHVPAHNQPHGANKAGLKETTPSKKAEVLQIRALYRAGATLSALTAMFGYKTATVSRIVNYETYKDVP